MTRKTIREIIRFNLKDSSFESMDPGFENWMLDKDYYAEKDEALEEIWNELDETPIRRLMEQPLSLIAEADKKRRSPWHESVVLKLSLWMGSVAAACLVVLSLCNVFGVFDSDMYLASGDDSKGYFVLPDDSKVWLNQGSTLYVPRGMSGRIRRVRLSGEGYFEVSKDVDRPFVVETGDFDVEVLGTKFTVSAYEGEPAAAYLSEGCVKVTGENVPETVLKPDQKFGRDEAGQWRVSAEKAANHTAWTGNSLFFDDAPITDIVQCLEHWYNVRISLSDSESLKSLNLTMTVRTEPLSEILGALGKLVGMEYHYLEGDHVFLDLD